MSGKDLPFLPSSGRFCGVQQVGTVCAVVAVMASLPTDSGEKHVRDQYQRQSAVHPGSDEND
jgi:hypothetical protein